MAITPKELEAKKKVNAKAFLDKLEEEIDVQLLEKPYNASMMIVDINAAEYNALLDAAIFKALEERYNGWLVRKVYTGQKDDSYQLTFVDRNKIPSGGPMDEMNGGFGNPNHR